MITLRKCAKIILILNNFCDLCINYQINLRNLKINFSTIKIKIKYFRANKIIRSMQLIMRDNQTCKSCKQIYLCVFKKIIITINKIEKIIVMITIKSSKHSIKLNVVHVTRKDISRIIERISNTQNIKKNEIIAKKKRKKFKFNVRRHSIKIKIAKTKITCFNLNNCDCHVL